MTAPARRTWYRKKRWAAAVLFSLSAGYPLTSAPTAYLHGRGWLGDRPFYWVDRVAYSPLAAALSAVPGTIGGHKLVWWWRTWNTGCYELGDRHRAVAAD